ncbi:MAG: hypothetical protein CVT68_09745 [Actinobacteria bacterium HGW-Actinobacteria-8]|nr:MAG: hypothetical protein CVT68_09745 [Actinobacteria bacterium HGW-Actinobacteria-8]
MTTNPSRDSGKISRNAANEETTVLTPVSDGTTALDRMPVKRQRLWIIVTSLLGVLLITAGIIIYRLVDVSNQWEAQVEDVKAQNYDLGQRLADEQAQVIQLQAQVDLVTEQLRTAQQRVLELADDVAQRDDNAEFYARQITDLTDVLTTASAVANSLNKCVDYQQQLVGILKEPDNYLPDQVATFEAGVTKVCDAATAANVDLQTVLAQ